MYKICQLCKKKYSPPYPLSKKGWQKRKYCSWNCRKQQGFGPPPIHYGDDNPSKREDVKIKISQKLKTYYQTHKAIGYWLGKKRSPETIEKMRKYRIGRKDSLEARKNKSKAQKGRIITWGNKLSLANKRRVALGIHNFWKGGVAKIHDKIRHSKEYKHWRIQVFQRDRFTCQICKTTGGIIEADHIIPFSTHPELRFDINNGRTLCKPCHKTTPTYGNKGKKFI